MEKLEFESLGDKKKTVEELVEELDTMIESATNYPHEESESSLEK